MGNKEKIEQAITKFVKGGDNSDTVLLESVLHDDFRITNNGFMGKPGVTVIDKKQYLTYIKDGIFGGLPRKMAIENVQDLGTIAHVTLWLESYQYDFVSFNSLVLDTDGNWKIISNHAEVQARARPELA